MGGIEVRVAVENRLILIAGRDDYELRTYESRTLFLGQKLVVNEFVAYINLAPYISGDQLVPVPDIQVTAIRLKDAAIVGQASAADVLGKGAEAGRKARQH